MTATGSRVGTSLLQSKRMKAVLQFAGVPLISQLCFSVAIFFTTAMLSQAAPAKELAAILACYNIQSVSMAWGRQALVVARVQRYSDELFANDIRQIASWSIKTAVAQFTISLMLASILTANILLALAVATWVSTAVIVDILRFTGARFDKRVLGHLATSSLQLVFACAFFAIGAGDFSVGVVLAVMALGNVIFSVAYFHQLRASCAPGVSWFRIAHGRFARNFGFETASNALLQASATVVLTSLSPRIAVGVLLVYQVIGTPTGMINQALSASLGRLVRVKMAKSILPRNLLLTWAAIIVGGTALLALAVTYPLNHVMLRLFGQNWNLTGPLMGGLAAYFCFMYLTQVLNLPTRWWIDSRAIRNWMIGAFCSFYLGLILAGTAFPEDVAVVTGMAALSYLLIGGGRVLISYIGRPKGFEWAS